MPLPKIHEETRERLCPKEVFCEEVHSRKFVCDILAEFEDSNPLLFDLLYNKMFLGPKNENLLKESSFDSVLASCAICRLIMEEGILPVISKDIYDRVWSEFKKDREEFIVRMGDRKYDPQIVFVIGVCCANYELEGFMNESKLVQAVAFIVYRMLELQAELEDS